MGTGSGCFFFMPPVWRIFGPVVPANHKPYFQGWVVGAQPPRGAFRVGSEGVRAVNAIKWEKLFAKPFICALNDHLDTVQCLAKHPTALTITQGPACLSPTKPPPHPGFADGVHCPSLRADPSPRRERVQTSCPRRPNQTHLHPPFKCCFQNQNSALFLLCCRHYHNSPNWTPLVRAQTRAKACAVRSGTLLS